MYKDRAGLVRGGTRLVPPLRRFQRQRPSEAPAAPEAVRV